MQWYDEQNIRIPNRYNMMTMLGTYKLWLNRLAPNDTKKTYYQFFDETYMFMS